MSERSTPDSADAHSNVSHLLVSAGELNEILSDEADFAEGAPRTRVLDVRWTLAKPDGHDDFLTGHIPGAVYVDLDTELAGVGPVTAGRHPLPRPEDFTAAARRWGLKRGDSVVAYDGGGNFGSARLWWLLKYFGFENVRLLDGALPAWSGVGLPLESGKATPAPGTIDLSPAHLPTLEFESVQEFARDHVLLDARVLERYIGADEPLDPRAGHIPGAVNLPTSGNLDEQGYFLPHSLLRERFAEAGALSGAPVGAYCGSGITASHALFALALAGGEGALYPGSWSQWANHPDLPIATGPTPE